MAVTIRERASELCHEALQPYLIKIGCSVAEKLDFCLGDMKEKETAESNLFLKCPLTSQSELSQRTSRVPDIRLRSVRLYLK